MAANSYLSSIWVHESSQKLPKSSRLKAFHEMFWRKTSQLFQKSVSRLRCACYCTQANTEFMNYLKNRIKIAGPISVATYMQEALTNPKWGYYMKKDVFGKSGDFITSPEISQMFGELLGIWLLNEWLQAKKPRDVKLVELGPGRGTLMADILRVFRQFKVSHDSLSVHLIEVSDKMRQMQRKLLCGADESNECCEMATSLYNGINVHWHNNIKDVPTGFTMYIAHEFFDALPVHVFKRTANGWREVLVNANDVGLELVVSPSASPLSELFIPKETVVDEYEICPSAGVTLEHMSKVVRTHGGSSLIVDYGRDGPSGNSLRSFKRHELVEDVFKYPGDADITANVDFSFLKKVCDNDVQTFGPITQSKFLKAMGIEARYKVLLQNANTKQAEDLTSAFNYLLGNDKMGEKFKVFAFNQSGSQIPAGF